MKQDHFNLPSFMRNVITKSCSAHVCFSKIFSFLENILHPLFISIVYLQDQNKLHFLLDACLTHIMAHYCSRHKMELPIENFKITGKSIPNHCNMCIEKDCAQYEATCTGHTMALADTLKTTGSFNDLCSELVVQKKNEHLTHSIIFNSKKLINIQVSDPGDNIEDLDLTTENGNNEFKSRPNSLAEKPC